jgi:hypothetical protein
LCFLGLRDNRTTSTAGATALVNSLLRSMNCTLEFLDLDPNHGVTLQQQESILLLCENNGGTKKDIEQLINEHAISVKSRLSICGHQSQN